MRIILQLVRGFTYARERLWGRRLSFNMIDDLIENDTAVDDVQDQDRSCDLTSTFTNIVLSHLQLESRV